MNKKNHKALTKRTQMDGKHLKQRARAELRMRRCHGKSELERAEKFCARIETAVE